MLLQVHSTWNYSFGGFPFSWISHSGAHKQLQFGGSEQLFQLCKTMSVGSDAFDQLAAQFASASGDYRLLLVAQKDCVVSSSRVVSGIVNVAVQQWKLTSPAVEGEFFLPGCLM